MQKMRELIAETPTTEWNGARVRITIEVPQLNTTMTSQIVIDRMQLEDLAHLNPPPHLDMVMEQNPQQGQYELMKWEQNKKKAENLIEMISNNVATHIARVIGKEL